MHNYYSILDKSAECVHFCKIEGGIWGCSKNSNLENSDLRPLKNIDCQLGVLETQTSAKLRVLSKVRTDWPDHSQTNHFDNEKCFFLKDFVETPSPSYMLFRI